MFIYRLTKAFDTHKLDYAIVGGWAMALHGAIRGTVDVDLVIGLSKENFITVEKIFKFMGFVSRLPVKAEQVFDFREEYIQNKNLVAWNFYNPKVPSETVDIIITKDLNKMSIKKIKSQERILKVLEINDLIQMKKESGRPQDLEDIKALEELKK